MTEHGQVKKPNEPRLPVTKREVNNVILPTSEPQPSDTSNKISALAAATIRDCRLPVQLRRQLATNIGRTHGNRYLTRIVTQSSVDLPGRVQRGVFDDVVIPHEDPLHQPKKPGSAESISLNPELFYLAKISEQRKVLNESSVGAPLEDFISALKEDVAAWQTFRKGEYDAEVIPGTRSANAAKALNKAIIYAQANEFASPAVRQLGHSFYASYVRRQLSGEELAHIEHMNRFNSTLPGTPTTAVETMLGIEADPVKHDYKMQIVWTSGGKGGAILQGGIFLRKIRILYSNDIGMSYTTELETATVHLSANAGVGVKRGMDSKNPQSDVPDTLGGDGFEGSRTEEILDEMGLGGEASGLKTINRVPGPNQWWKPEDFNAVLTIFKLGGGAGAGVGPVKLSLAEGSLFEIFMFEKDGRTLAFDTSSVEGEAKEKDEEAKTITAEFLEKLKSAKLSNDTDTAASLGLSGSLEFEFGSVYDIQVTEKGATDDVEPAEEQEFGEWTSINESSLFFDTSSVEIKSDSEHVIAHIAEKVAAHNAKYPGSKFFFDIIGHASPRWDHPGKKNARQLNYDLANERAHKVRNLLEVYRRSVGKGDLVCEYDESIDVGSLDSEYDDRVDSHGAEDALAAGAESTSDDVTDRRVDISTLAYYNFTELFKR